MNVVGGGVGEGHCEDVVDISSSDCSRGLADVEEGWSDYTPRPLHFLGMASSKPTAFDYRRSISESSATWDLES